MSTNKQYIGSGKSTQNNGVKVTLRVEDAAKHIYRTDRGEFLTFIVAPRRERDEYGKTHTAFVLLREEPVAEPSAVAEPAAEPAKVRGRRLRKITPEEAAALRAQQELL